MPQQNTTKFSFGYGWSLGENPGTQPLDEMRLILDAAIKTDFAYNPILTNGLNYYYFGGALFDQYGTIHIYNGGSIILTPSTTNYVYRINETVVADTVGFPLNAVPMSIVVTDSINVLSVEDLRPSELTATQLRFISDNAMLPTGTIKEALDLAGTHIQTLFNHFGNNPNAVYLTTANGTLPIVVDQSIPGTATISINPADAVNPGTMSTAHFIVVDSATDLALGDSLVKRDLSGNFSANFITATLLGSASNALALENNNAAYYLDRINHTGMQPVSTITNFAFTVQSYSLDLFAAPQLPVDFNLQRLMNLGTPTNGSDAATKDYADGLVTGLLDARDNYDASSNMFPATGGSGIGSVIKKGDIWFISVQGTLGSKSVLVGDSVRALVDDPGQIETNWGILNSGLGYIPQPRNTDLDAIVALTPSSDDIIQRKAGVWVNRTLAQLRTDLIGYTPEDSANKSTNTSLGTSDILYPTQNAVKTYVDAVAATKQALSTILTNIAAVATTGILVLGASGTASTLAAGTANQVVGMNAAETSLENKSILGTANQVVVNHAAGSITLSLPQSIHTSATPTFAGIITSKIYPSTDSTTAVQILKADGTTPVVTVDTTAIAKVDISTANLDLDFTTFANQFGVISKNGTRFIHDFNYGNNGTVTTAGNNTFVGVNAGNLTMGSTATQTYQSSYNSALGVNALQNNTTGNNNSALGVSALQNNTTGNYNSALGVYALQNNTTGYYNSALGVNALYSNTTGYYNSALGMYALLDLGSAQTAGAFNIGTSYTIATVGTTDFTLIGAASNTVGVVFTATGVGTGTGTATPNNTSSNTAIGYNTGRGIIYGTGNTILGANVIGLAAGLTNNIILADGTGNQRITVDSLGNMNLWNSGVSQFRVSNAGLITSPSTITAPGTTGAQTINKPTGRVNIAAAGTSVVVTNSLVTANSIIIAIPATNDATARVTSVVPAAGSFTINTVAVTAETAFSFLIFN